MKQVVVNQIAKYDPTFPSTARQNQRRDHAQLNNHRRTLVHYDTANRAPAARKEHRDARYGISDSVRKLHKLSQQHCAVDIAALATEDGPDMVASDGINVVEQLLVAGQQPRDMVVALTPNPDRPFVNYNPGRVVVVLFGDDELFAAAEPEKIDNIDDGETVPIAAAEREEIDYIDGGETVPTDVILHSQECHDLRDAGEAFQWNGFSIRERI